MAIRCILSILSKFRCSSSPLGFFAVKLDLPFSSSLSNYRSGPIIAGPLGSFLDNGCRGIYFLSPMATTWDCVRM